MPCFLQQQDAGNVKPEFSYEADVLSASRDLTVLGWDSSWLLWLLAAILLVP